MGLIHLKKVFPVLDFCSSDPRLPLQSAYTKLTVLVSAGRELIFFLVAGTVLCFGFSVRIMLITL